MRLSDIMGGLDLTVFPQAAMVMFVGIFAVVLVRVLGRSRRTEMERAAGLPLDDGAIERRSHT